MSLDGVLRHLEAVEQHGSNYGARCPAHDDRHASLSLTSADDGRVLVTCHAGCRFKDIVTASGIPVTEFFATANQMPTNGDGVAPRRVAATYPYCSEDGTVLYEVVRLEPKDFR